LRAKIIDLNERNTEKDNETIELKAKIINANERNKEKKQWNYWCQCKK
jgi:hypothetical protein